MRRTPSRRAKPASLEQLRTVLGKVERKSWPGAVIGRRDTAMLLVGFACALRRADLVVLTLGDLDIQDGTLVVTIRSSKTDQHAEGATLAVPRGTRRSTCAACAVLDWTMVLDAWEQAGRVGVLALLHQERQQRALAAALSSADGTAADATPAGPAGGSGRGHACTNPDALATWARLVDEAAGRPWLRPVTKAATITDRALSGEAVNQVVHRRLVAAGVDPAGYSAHSLRAGFVTDAFRAGAPAHDIMRQTRHRSPATLEGYARHYTPLEANAVTRIGL